ncbi:OmpG porin family protein [Edwardsiella piscicida]
MFSMEKKENLAKGLTTNTDYLSWELEPGIRYFITPNINTTVAYFQSGKHANKQNEFETRELQRNQQVRVYLNWNTPIGLVISPSTRQSVFGEITERNAKGDFINKDMSRYTLQLAYPINNQWRVMTEYYHEKIKTKNSDLKTEYDYFKVAVRASF